MANSIFVDPSGVVPNGVATGSVLVSNGVNAPPVFSATPTVTSLTVGLGGVAPVSIGFVGDPTTGIYSQGTGQIGFSLAGAERIRIYAATIELRQSEILGWSSADNVTSGLDLGISRLGAASLAIGNGTGGDFSGSLNLTTLNAVGAYQFAGAAFVTATIGPSNPATTASTTLVMAGLAGSITTQTGRVEFTMSGTQSDGTVSDGSKVQISYGTGTAPVNGAALTGTQAGSIISFVVPGVTAATGGFSAAWIATGLTLNTAYWFDVAYASVTGGTTTISSVAMTARDIL